MKAALVSAQPKIGDTRANLSHAVKTVEAEAAAGADLVVFPEMFLTGYLVRDEVRQAALDAEGPELGEVADACRRARAHVVVGFPRRTDVRGVLANATALLGPDGLVGVYDKVYLPTFSVFEEDLYFREGNELPVFETPIGRIAMCICYDLFFPEVTKAYALRGADVIVCASASPTTSQRYFEAVFPARAIETTSWLLYTNLAGPQDTLSFWGGPQAWSPRGELMAKGPYHEESTLRVDVDLKVVEEMRMKRPALRDTRPEILRELLESR